MTEIFAHGPMAKNRKNQQMIIALTEDWLQLKAKGNLLSLRRWLSCQHYKIGFAPSLVDLDFSCYGELIP